MSQETLHFQTPIIQDVSLSHRLKKNIFFKMDCWQPVGSFKIRGIGYMCRRLVGEGIKHLVSSSGGNAGYAVAYAGSALKVRVSVVVPQSTPERVRKKMEEEGADVIIHGKVWDEAHEYALGLAEEEATAYVPPFDHPDLWTGHATMVDEIVQQIEKPDVIVLAVGGGGLLCGVIEGLHQNHGEDVPIIAVETEGAASLHASLEQGKLVTLDRIDSVASSLGAKQVTQQALELADVHEIQSLVVSDQEAVESCFQFADSHRVLVEPACGAALAAVYLRPEVLGEAKNVLVVVCGGLGVTLEQLQQWKADLK